MRFLVPLLVILLAGTACARREPQMSSSGPAPKAKAVAESDESKVRLAIYARYMNSDSRTYVVDESDIFVRSLRVRTQRSIFHPKDRPDGWKLKIAGLKISGDVAQAGFAAVGGNVGGEFFSVRLRKVADDWEIVEWRLSAAS